MSRKKPVDQMSLKIESRSVNESFGRAAVAAFLTQLDPTVADLTDMKTAVSEAVTNAIVHGYKDRRGTVYITAKLFENGKAVVRVRDKGCGISDIQKAMEPLFTTGGEERAGLGFAVMESLMDKVKVSSKLGKGTTVTLEKKILSKGSAREMLPEGENHAHDGRA